MNYIKKSEFIKQASANIQAWKLAQLAIDALIQSPIVKAQDGKHTNKRFIDKLQGKINVEGYPVIVSLTPQSYTNFLAVAINLDLSSNKELYYKVQNSILYYKLEQDDDECEPYLCLHDRIFNYNNFVFWLERFKGILDNRIKEYQNCIERIDEVQEKYNKIQKYITEMQKDIPMPLYHYISFSNPIYD